MEEDKLVQMPEEDAAITEDIPEPATDEEEAKPEDTNSFDIGVDLKELAEEFPKLAEDSPEAFMNTARYEELRALGLSPKEAYLATSKKAEYRADSRAHLSGTVPKRAHAVGTGMSAGELAAAREIFGGMSDEEIRSLYRRVTK